MELRPSATWMGNWFVRDHAGSCSFLLRSGTRSQDSVGLYARMEIVDESQDSCEGRGRRPRLQRCGNASILTTSCAPTKVMPKNGITFGRIRYGRVLFVRPMTGPILEALSPCNKQP